MHEAMGSCCYMMSGVAPCAPLFYAKAFAYHKSRCGTSPSKQIISDPTSLTQASEIANSRRESSGLGSGCQSQFCEARACQRPNTP